MSIYGVKGELYTKLQNFRLVQIESIKFGVDKLNMNQKLNFVLGRVENIAGKGESAGYQHFLLFTQCFQKASFPRSLKVGLV